MIISRCRIGEFVLLAAIILLLVVAGAEGCQSDQTVSENTSEQRKEFLDSLTEKTDSPDECYDLLKRRLLEGHFEDVKAALELQDQSGKRIFSDYRFARLRARCARVIFQLYSRRANPLGWPSEEQGAEMRRLAREATAAYEEAFRLAPSDFERACVYARWHELHTRGRFEADSLSLRDGSPLEHLNEPTDERLSKQVSLLRSRASRVIDSVTLSGKPMVQEAKTIFLDVLADEYARLGRIGVSDGVFNEVLEDIPVFLQGAIHSSVLAEPKKYYITLRYHIWYALTGPRPDKIDNEYIDKQIETVNRYIHEGFAEEPLEYEEAMSKTFLELVELERGNRFIPRFKQPLWPFEWSQARNKYQKSIEGDILEKIDKTVTRIIEYENRQISRISRLRTIDDIEKRIQDNVASSIKSLAASLMLELMSYQRLQHYRQPPDVRVTSSGGSTHRNSGIWVYTAGKYEPVLPYPWKKQITPIDSCTASTRRIAGRVLKALAQGDMATLDTLIVESRDFSKQDVYKLARELNDNLYATEPENIQDINDILIEDAWSWSVVRIQPPANRTESTLVLVFQWKTREYWLAWAGIVEEWSGRSLASLLEELKPGLELPPVPESVEIVPPADIASVDDISEMESLESLDAGHSWRVQLALTDGDSSTPLKLLYCRAEWTDQNRPPKPVPFGRYAARHLGPVIWTLSENSFQENAPELNSRPAPPMSLRGDGCVYAAVMPLSGFKQTYVQVYSAFDGRELARHCISPAESSFWSWGRFIAHQKGKSFGVATFFKAARPGMPAFRPIHTLPEKTPKEKDISINLSLKDGFFVLKVDKRILPTQGSRLLARWWLNDRLVLPQASEDLTFPENADTEGLANLLRLPAAPPTVSLKAKPGDKISLQVMLSPDRLGSPSITNMFEQSIACLTGDDLPPIPVLSNRISFKADSEMLTQSSPRAATAASFKELTEAIKKENVRKVRSLVATCPQLVYFRDSSNRIALDYVCYERPRARYIWRWKIGGDVTARYWKKMAEIAGILIDYGADVNAKARRRKTPLQVLLDSEKSFGQDENAPPVELVQLLLDRGADLDVGSTGRGSTEGTVLHQAVGVIQPRNSKRLIPVVEILLDYGADVFAISEPWKSEPVFDMVDSMKQKGNAELAAMISKYGEKRRKVLEQKVRLGVEEFLSSIRHAGEKELLALNEELPIVPGLEWLSVGRMLQKEMGPALEGLGGIDKLSLKGNWAEVLLPTGLEGDKANLLIVLMRYPGGGYHAVMAGLHGDRGAGRSIRSAELTFRELINAVYSAFGRMDMCQISGGRSTGYPNRVPLLSISNERGRLVARGLDLPSWVYFHAELTSDVVFLWDDIWELSLSRKMTFKTDDRQILMADGSITVQNGEKTVIFSMSEGQVIAETDDTEFQNSEFILDMNTLEVKYDDTDG